VKRVRLPTSQLNLPTWRRLRSQPSRHMVTTMCNAARNLHRHVYRAGYIGDA
jgi:hypothetical protein